MARIFITGSVDGLGQLAANALVHSGHSVVLHARNSQRAKYGLSSTRSRDHTDGGFVQYRRN